MKTALTLLAVVTIVVPPNLSARQLSAEPGMPVVRAGISESDSELTPGVKVHVQRGDLLRSELRFTEAAVEYRRAADVARREGHLPSGTTWMLANAYFNDGNLLGAAAALDQLTADAARVGDLAVEALAIFNSAWLNGKAGHKSETAARVARLEILLRSPYMPVAIRDHLSSWLKTSRELATLEPAS
jgi:ATP/maltotriose-dependent transcriptional regulator MalT